MPAEPVAVEADVADDVRGERRARIRAAVRFEEVDAGELQLARPRAVTSSGSCRAIQAKLPSPRSFASISRAVRPMPRTPASAFATARAIGDRPADRRRSIRRRRSPRARVLARRGSSRAPGLQRERPLLLPLRARDVVIVPHELHLHEPRRRRPRAQAARKAKTAGGGAGRGHQRPPPGGASEFIGAGVRRRAGGEAPDSRTGRRSRAVDHHDRLRIGRRESELAAFVSTVSNDVRRSSSSCERLVRGLGVFAAFSAGAWPRGRGGSPRGSAR